MEGRRPEECADTPRLRREDHPGANHGLSFSEWEVLIGPSDWEDHSSGKDGAERYRHQNLPVDGSGPGVYEFAIPATPTGDGRVIRKLDKACIVPVYVGAADDVRTRLQRYGRDGAHLDHGKSSAAKIEPGLFKDIFEKGYPILYRWAPIESREEAEEKEAELLDMYDYAWNKRGNGPSRRGEVLERLKNMDFCTATPPRGTRKGKEPASGKKQSRRSGSSRASPQKVEHPDDQVIHSSIPSLSIVRYRPRLVEEPWYSYMGTGAPKEDGNRPVDKTKLSPGDEGERTGLRTGTEFPGTKDRIGTSGVITEDVPAAGKRFDPKRSKQNIQSKHHSPPEVQDNKETHGCILPSITLADDDNICGAIRGDGSLCRNRPDRGRRRCDEHKGQRVNASDPQEGSSVWTAGGFTGTRCPGTRGRVATSGVIIEDATPSMVPRAAEKRSDSNRGKLTFQSTQRTTHEVEDNRETYRCFVPTMTLVDDNICGVTRGDGSVCRNTPDRGRRRCDEHKGQRVNGSGLIERRSLCTVGGQSSVCGVPLADGSICTQLPVCGRRRCEDHKGRRITGTSLMGGSPVRASEFSVASSCCGVIMSNGSACMASPFPGRMRCGRHKGKRI